MVDPCHKWGQIFISHSQKRTIEWMRRILDHGATKLISCQISENSDTEQIMFLFNEWEYFSGTERKRKKKKKKKKKKTWWNHKRPPNEYHHSFTVFFLLRVWWGLQEKRKKNMQFVLCLFYKIRKRSLWIRLSIILLG